MKLFSTLLVVVLASSALACKGSSSKKSKEARASSSAAKSAEVPGGWSAVGLDGSVVSQIAVDRKNPSNVFLSLAAGGAEQGMWRSKDSAKTWKKMGGLPDRPGGSIAVHPQLGTVIASPGAEGIFRSSDGGETWTKSSSAATDPGATAMFFHPTANTAWTVNHQAGLWRSEDGGASWVHTKNQNLPLNQFGVGPLAFDGAKLYLATDGRGVYATTDNGDSWTLATTSGLPDAAGGGGITNLVAHPSRPGVLFAHMRAGVFRSTDSGATFTKLDLGGVPPGYFGLLVDPSNTSTIFATASGSAPGILKTSDDGKSWRSIGPKDVAVNCIEIAPDGTLYAGTLGKGIWRLGK